MKQIDDQVLDNIQKDLNKEWPDDTWLCYFHENIIRVIAVGKQTVCSINLETSTVTFSDTPFLFYQEHISLYAKYIPEILIRIT